MRKKFIATLTHSIHRNSAGVNYPGEANPTTDFHAAFLLDIRLNNIS